MQDGCPVLQDALQTAKISGSGAQNMPGSDRAVGFCNSQDSAEERRFNQSRLQRAQSAPWWSASFAGEAPKTIARGRAPSRCLSGTCTATSRWMPVDFAGFLRRGAPPLSSCPRRRTWTSGVGPGQGRCPRLPRVPAPCEEHDLTGFHRAACSTLVPSCARWGEQGPRVVSWPTSCSSIGHRRRRCHLHRAQT